MNSTPPNDPAFAGTVRKLSLLNACLPLVGAQAGAAIATEIDEVLRSCPRDQRPDLLAKAEAHPHASEAASALERRLADCLASIAESFSKAISTMNKSRLSGESPMLFHDIPTLIERSRASGQVERALDEKLTALAVTLDRFAAQAVPIAVEWLSVRARAVSPASIEVACAREGSPATAQSCWEHYKRLLSEQVEGEKGNSVLSELNIEIEVNTRVLKHLHGAHASAPRGTPR